jgi:hypothetical protein
MVSPLLLLALLYTRRKHRTKFDTLLVVLVLLSAVGLSLSAYTSVQAEALPASSGGGADAPSMPMGYASTAEAGTSSGVAAGNPGGAVESPTTENSCGLPSWDQIGTYIGSEFSRLFSVVGNSYSLGWKNFVTAINVLLNPNSNYYQKQFALSYITIWGGAHYTAAAGIIIIGYVFWQVVVLGETYCVANQSCIAVEVNSYQAMEAAGFRFTQTTASSFFSEDGVFSGKTIGEVADLLRKGLLDPESVPVRFVERNGVKLIENTRSALALLRSGIPFERWNLIDMSGTEVELKLLQRLAENSLTDLGTTVIRITGMGQYISNLQ